MGKTYRLVRAVVCIATALACGGVCDRTCAGTLNTDVVFTDNTPLSSNVELARRLLTPLTSAQLPALVAKTGKKLSEQPIDLAQEKFVVTVPTTKPANGYGLIVFVPPWDAGKVPEAWTDVLDQYGLIYVSESNS